jgi:hypothetical protein
MKTHNLKAIMNSSVALRAALPAARFLALIVCLAWLAAPRSVPGQQTNAQQKVELIEQVQQLTGTNGVSGEFGLASAMSGDTMVIGAYASSSRGEAYVFVRQGANWSLQQTLYGDNQYFGNSVAIDGNTIVVGAHRESSGAAYVFVRTGTTWARQAKLGPGTSGQYEQHATFGYSVAISGNTIIVGEPLYSLDYRDIYWEGAAQVFQRSGTSWTKIKSLTGDRYSEDVFGAAVAVNGSTVVVGAPGHDGPNGNCGTAYAFNQANNWAQTRLTVSGTSPAAGAMFGAALAVSTDFIVVGSRFGTAYVFGNPTYSWQQTLIPSNPPRVGDFSGSQDPLGAAPTPAGAVAISGDVLVVGFEGDDQGGTDCGSAYLFVRQGNAWAEKRKFTASDAAAGDFFGCSVAASSDTVVVGAFRKNSYSGAAYVFSPGYHNPTNVASYVKRLLYVPDAAASPFFNPWDAAFLYKYRLYGQGTNAQGANVIQPQFEHISDYWPGPNNVYLARSQQAEAELRQGLAMSPGDDTLGDLLLDIYYDRAVADALFARDALATADKARFGGPGLTIAPPPAAGHFVIENEINSYEAALRTNRMALSNYFVLLRDPGDSAFFQRLVPSRGLSPATYLTTNAANGVTSYVEHSVTADSTPLFTGYKDLALIADLLRDYGQTAVTLARLYVARGDGAAVTNFAADTQRFLLFQSSLWGTLFPSLVLATNDASGLAQAFAGINNSLADLEVAKQRLSGLVNPLGFAQDFLMFVQSRGTTGSKDTFDTLKTFLDPNLPGSNPLLTALDELQTLEESYKIYRESEDEMAEQFSDSSVTYNDRLRDIVGVFPDDVRYSDDPTANPGSDLNLQYGKVSLARNQIFRNQTQMDNLVKQVQIEIDKTTSISNIVVNYAGKRAAIAEKIGYINAAQGAANAVAQGCSPEKLASGAFMADLTSAMMQGCGEAAKGQLEGDKERLGADEQAEVLGAELNATVKSLLLEMNVLLVDSREAALNLQQEVSGLQALYREKQDLERKLVQRDNRLSRRYFADPVHRLSVQAGMIRATQAFEQAQRWLFFMARALEYKWNEPFQNYLAADGRYWSSASVFQLRNATELQDCYNALCDYDAPKSATTPWGADDWDVFSLRKDAYGYRTGTNALGQPLRYVVATNGGNSEPLDATNAFRLRLSQQITNTGSGQELWLHFNTARAVGNLYLAPTYTATSPPTPIPGRYGTYLDKIIEMRIRLAGNHSLSDGEVSQVTLTYAGTSYIRNPSVGDYATNRADRLCREATTYSTRFWQYTGPGALDWLEVEALTAQGLKVRRSRVAESPAPAIKSVIEFSDRSVAASDWTLTIPLLDSHGDPNFDLNELDDIEIYFYHRAASRTH